MHYVAYDKQNIHLPGHGEVLSGCDPGTLYSVWGSYSLVPLKPLEYHSMWLVNCRCPQLDEQYSAYVPQTLTENVHN